MPWRTNRGASAPWGWWLRANGRVLEDEDGRQWRSVRDAFWQGAMRFPEIHFFQEQHELLLRVLTAVDQRWSSGTENRLDLFAGDMEFWRFYMCWLSSIGMTKDGTGATPLEAPLSDLGRSVMLMLQATSEPGWIDMPLRSIIEAIRHPELRASDDARQVSLAALERGVAHRRHVFAREQVQQLHLVTLTGLGLGARMPTRRVTWSQSFADDHDRDDFFGWLAEHVDRWDDWGALAYSRGAPALTQHFLALMTAKAVR
ncbi:hypothetical protein EQZ23_06890 [Sphingomonas sp. UV9]|uniref:hypothetical protein n=1 Tax=Sphingomonas sp. UV9 TaxID=1851410 RepID=UPI000FFBF6E6|nr:hypothetical protein [Sphingomonas sp. UV9]RXD04862.1 hypothetical protein EQZ23_06890 [Sphingomonas sp. UV9]